MTEKILQQKLRKITLLVLAIFSLAAFVIHVFEDRSYTGTLNLYSPGAESARYEFSDDAVVSLTSFTQTENTITYTVEPLSMGYTDLTFFDSVSGEYLAATSLRVMPGGLIFDLLEGTYANHRIHMILQMALLLALCVILWAFWRIALKRLHYSYISIFLGGFALWLTSIALYELSYVIRDANPIDFFTALQSAGSIFMLFSLPFMVIFSLALIISNISLIRHEGKRMVNFLGIILSLMLLVGEAVLWVGERLVYSFVHTGVNIMITNIIFSTYTSVYVLVECFLIGSIIAGLNAAMHEPAYNKDYIIILGCMIRKDGSLTPLLAGRVDRAIKFYQNQLKNGKDSIFIPSGGQGRNEVMPEAQAMKNYLIQKGIPEEKILAEDASFNTLQNMKNSRALIEARKPKAKSVFSTTNYHVFRSGIISRQVGFEPEGIGSKTKWWFWPNAFVREVAGMITYKKRTLLIISIILVAFFAALEIMIALFYGIL